ncbi:MAG TPA: RidA family protein [Chloroflexota bacterium]|jgi:enamine deaminase RidA (YjgF/YER057c/UK114 family)|nr:RidA family protein [Chloroflexota bacterium]
MPVERIQPAGLSQAPVNAGQPSYAHVVKAGNTVYVSGQVARNANGELVGKGDIEAQVTQVFENLKTAMAAAGGDLRNLVKVVIYLTDPRFRDAIRLVQPRYLREELPASTMVIVKGLASPEYLVEIDAIAVVE